MPTAVELFKKQLTMADKDAEAQLRQFCERFGKKDSKDVLRRISLVRELFAAVMEGHSVILRSVTVPAGIPDSENTRDAETAMGFIQEHFSLSEGSVEEDIASRIATGYADHRANIRRALTYAERLI